jgi:hypothetical protein
VVVAAERRIISAHKVIEARAACAALAWIEGRSGAQDQEGATHRRLKHKSGPADDGTAENLPVPSRTERRNAQCLSSPRIGKSTAPCGKCGAGCDPNS